MPRYRHHLVALLGYLALTLLLTYPLVREFARAIPGDGFDGWQNVWNIWWVKQALLVQGTNPYFTHLLDYPAGAYLYFHTLNIFNGLTFLPITLNAGNLVAYNAAAAFSFVSGGYGTYLLALRAIGSDTQNSPAGRTPMRLAAFVGGSVFAFSPYHMAHLLGHMQLISLEWLPFTGLAVVILLSRCRARGSERIPDAARRCLRIAALAALFMVLVALCDWYYAFYMGLFSALYWLWMALRRRAGWTATLALALAGVLFLCVTALLWVPMVRETLSSDYMVPEAGSTERLSADLLAFVTPSTLHPWWGQWANGWAERFTASLSERTVFVGFAVLALALLGVVAFRRRAAIWGVTSLVFAVLAMGPVLHVGGQTQFLGVGPIPLPYALLVQLVPLLRISRSVSRFDVVVMLSLGVLAAMGTAWLLRRLDPGRVSLPAVVMTLALLGVIGLEYLVIPYPMSFPETQPFHYELARAPGEFGVMDLPMDHWDRPANLLYQTVHHKPLVSAYTSRTNPLAPAWRTPVLQTFRNLGPDINSGDPRALAGSVMRDLNVRYVIVHKNDLPPGAYREQTLALAQSVFGDWPVEVDDAWLKVYRRPEEIGLRLPYLVLGDGWGERQWDGQRVMRTITSPEATATARMAAAEPVYVEVEAFSGRPATLEVTAGAGQSASWFLAPQPTVLRTPPWSLPAGETIISLRVEPPSDRVTIKRLVLVAADAS